MCLASNFVPRTTKGHTGKVCKVGSTTKKTVVVVNKRKLCKPTTESVAPKSVDTILDSFFGPVSFTPLENLKQTELLFSWDDLTSMQMEAS
eukprot:CAMPEP_0194573758 /NCGR_PEP_ID=MMETSP0292-20121207/9858_1 /TAXON_ID=39354 /ORGANISM="Heterosigma akashiwo, Strain CCMP2393" /LENGTH=90 /DNA_ID=CAMNT_0039425097 /DNA_START=188 /DNA_END=460 /DNA_ORIENTATION=-